MKKYLGCFLLLVTLSLQAQNDRLFLNNGNLLKGVIANDTLSDTIRIEISQVMILVPFEAINEIYPNRRHNQKLLYLRTGPVRSMSTNLTFGIVSGKSSSSAPSVMRPAGYIGQFYHAHTLFNIGLQTGIVDYKEYTVYPTSIEYQAHFGRSYRNWLVYGNAGYGFAKATQEYEEQFSLSGGYNYQLGVGYHIAQDRYAFQFKVGYSVQKIEATITYSDDYSTIRQRRLNKITIQITYRISYQ